MSFIGPRRFVGFGFGAIQAGLFLHEAHRSGRYAPPLVVEVRRDLVESLRASSGNYQLNIARRDRIDTVEIGPIEVATAIDADGRDRIVQSITTADEASTALPSVDFYRSTERSSPHLLLARGLSRRQAARPLVVYCAENHRRAAQLLEEAILQELPSPDRDLVRRRARFVDTVIGKMCGVVTDAAQISELRLAPLAPGISAAVLVEEFNHILTSRATSTGAADIQPGMAALHPVDSLEPFAAAKLFGHNATHALAAYLGRLLGLRLISELRSVPGAMPFLRSAFLEESGRALCSRYAGSDPMFTPHGFRSFADDLLDRMVNPFLADTVERAARDPTRKLGWADRLIGTLRLGLDTGIPMPRYSMGAAAALADLRTGILAGPPAALEQLLLSCWPPDVNPREASAVVELVVRGHADLRAWIRADGRADLLAQAVE